MSYTNYVVGVTDTRGAGVGGAYNFLVSGLNDYTGATGIMIKNDTTLAAANNKGTRIYQDSNDNAYMDFRTNATDGAQNLAFRMQDDANPSAAPSNMLVLNKDTVTDASVYGATVGGRVKASQYYAGTADTRAPNLPGVYMGFDSNTVGYFKINKGAGTGGFTFNTYKADGSLDKNNMNLFAAGNVQVPYYSTVTNDTQDSETTAFASFDSNGNIVRDYKQNQRIRSIENRVATLESQTVASVPEKVNEVIGRINSLNFFSTPISNLVVPAPPVPNPFPQPTNNNPYPNITSVKVTLAITSQAKTAHDANSATFITNFKNAAVTNVNNALSLSGASGLVASRITAFAIGTSFTENGYPTYPAGATIPSGTNPMWLITFVINPDSSSVSRVSPTLAATTLRENSDANTTSQNLVANSFNSALKSELSLSADVLDIYYVSRQDDVQFTA